MNILIDKFINQKINIPTYINCINEFNFDKFNLIDYLKDFNSSDLIDERMNAILILWFLKYDLFDLNIDTRYLAYLKELISEVEIIKPKIINFTDNYLIAKVDKVFFIINHCSFENTIKLPNELINKTVYCYNCNDEMELYNNITLPEFSFYALIIE